MKNSLPIHPALLLLSLSFVVAPFAMAAPKAQSREYRPLMAKAVRIELSGQAGAQGKAAVATREGWGHFDKAQWEKAMDRFLSALELDPTNASAAEGLTMAVYRSGDRRSAAELGEEFSSSMPWIRNMVAESILADAKDGVERGEVAALRELVAALPYGGGAYAPVRILVESASLERIETARNTVAQAVE